jgi:hypothetical protein
MERQEDPARPGVTLGDVVAVLELARMRLDPMTPVPTSWAGVIDQVRAVLAAQVAGPHPRDAAPRAPAPGSSTGHHQRTSHS